MRGWLVLVLALAAAPASAQPIVDVGLTEDSELGPLVTIEALGIAAGVGVIYAAPNDIAGLWGLAQKKVDIDKLTIANALGRLR